MNRTIIATLYSIVTSSILQPVVAEEPNALIERGTLIFHDDFIRPVGAGLGDEWVVNGKDEMQQARLEDGTLFIERAPDAGHSVVVRHDAPFDDGVLKVRFRIFDKLGLKLNFNDPKAKDVAWAGHIARVVAQPNMITISDDITGTYNLTVRAKRRDKSLPAEEKAELEEFIKSKQPTFEAPIKVGQWHELTVVYTGPKVEVYIDTTAVGSFVSEGLDHEVKQNVVFGVGGKVEVDQIRVWSLD